MLIQRKAEIFLVKFRKSQAKHFLEIALRQFPEIPHITCKAFFRNCLKLKDRSYQLNTIALTI